MGKAAELKNTTDLVLEILQNNTKARNSDNELYYWVCAKIGDRNGIDVHKMSMPQFFLHLKEYGFPAFETVRRTRQKIQAENPDLKPDKNIEVHRMLNEEDFKNYARGIHT